MRKDVAPLGDAELKMRRTAHTLGSEALCDAIEDLIARTAARIDVPPQWQHRRLAFARAYLGMEVDMPPSQSRSS
ncbi:hypothetical protein RLDS_16080 [Sphingobium lactosutens DS20]|uniref:Uncharacterized protein n=2 Tax=Sphingobium TaxID=165695 RepID=T0IN85_9SPHN|nr:hypothetical protein RLDS_16080 [Sphingobium lactosutens DS20]